MSSTFFGFSSFFENRSGTFQNKVIFVKELQHKKTSCRWIRQDVWNDMVEATGFEPAASCSQSKHSTKLSYASNGENSHSTLIIA